jgi:lipoprotein-anchoring transpeptidase ErfK/SrfK
VPDGAHHRSPSRKREIHMTSTSSSKLIAALTLTATCAVSAAVVAPARARPVVGAPATTRLAVLEREHGAFARPDYRSRRMATVDRRRPITGGPTVLPVLAERTVADGRRWLRVRLPGRPNSHGGWIASRQTSYAQTPWRIIVSTSARRVTVVRSKRVTRRFSAVVGAPWTPTPHGRFFVEESVRLRPDLVGAPFALALSARSNVLEQFAGGPGQIALHGLGNVGGTPGTAASHGCLRLAHADIDWLATHIGPGTPVEIVR